MALTITTENAADLLIASTISKEQFEAFFAATLADKVKVVRQDTTNVKHTDKGGLWIRTPDMVCPVKPESYAKKLADGKAAKSTYNAAVNMLDGQWQAFFTCDDRAGLAEACREHGAGCLASVLDFIDGLGDDATVDTARIEAVSMSRIDAHAKAVKAAEKDDETDAEYAARSGK